MLFIFYLLFIYTASAAQLSEYFNHYDTIEHQVLSKRSLSQETRIKVSYRGLPMTLVLKSSPIAPSTKEISHLSGHVENVQGSQVRLTSTPTQILQGIISFGNVKFGPLYIDRMQRFDTSSAKKSIMYQLDDVAGAFNEPPRSGLFKRSTSKSLANLAAVLERREPKKGGSSKGSKGKGRGRGRKNDESEQEIKQAPPPAPAQASPSPPVEEPEPNQRTRQEPAQANPSPPAEEPEVKQQPNEQLKELPQEPDQNPPPQEPEQAPPPAPTPVEQPEVVQQPNNQVPVLPEAEAPEPPQESAPEPAPAPASSNGLCKMLVIADRKWVESHQDVPGGIENEIIGLVNQVTAFDEQFDITLQVERVILDTDGSLVGEQPRSEVNGRVLQSGITGYLKDQAEASPLFNAADFCTVMFMQGEDFDDGTIGKAKFGDDLICTSSNILVVVDRTSRFGREKIISTITHEMGHVFFADHDEETACEGDGFVMSSRVPFNTPESLRFSTCSIPTMEFAISRQRAQECLGL
jgi:hypothetical protein